MEAGVPLASTPVMYLTASDCTVGLQRKSAGCTDVVQISAFQSR
jgi:hypothetical protein